MNFEDYNNLATSTYKEDLKNKPSKWQITDSLKRKVGIEGDFKYFFGSTSVLKLHEEDIQKCEKVADYIYNRFNDVVKLYPHTFHATVHSYYNPYNVSGDEAEIKSKAHEIEPNIKALFSRINKKYGNEHIVMSSLGPSSGGSDGTSIKFVPKTEKDFEILYTIQYESKQVFPLEKYILPHVSLFYFKLKEYSVDELDTLYEIFNSKIAIYNFDISIPVNELVYQHHEDMNHFIDVFMVKNC